MLGASLRTATASVAGVGPCAIEHRDETDEQRDREDREDMTRIGSPRGRRRRLGHVVRSVRRFVVQLDGGQRRGRLAFREEQRRLGVEGGLRLPFGRLRPAVSGGERAAPLLQPARRSLLFPGFPRFSPAKRRLVLVHRTLVVDRGQNGSTAMSIRECV
jgi:hypothetical protein